MSPAAMKGFRLIGHGELSGGQQRILWIAIVSEDKSMVAAKIDYMLVRGRKLYVAHCMATADKIEQRRPRFDAIVRSMTFRGALAVANGSAPVPIQPTNEAYENGRVVGRITVYAMIAAVALYGIIALVRRIRQ
jgi:hypothetical protein